MPVSRRAALKGWAGVSLSSLWSSQTWAVDTRPTLPAPSLDDAAAMSVFVPGYMPEAASYRGRPVAQDRNFARAIRRTDQPFRMLSKVRLDGEILQTLLPTHAHDVKISPSRKTGVLCGFEARDHVAFDADTLDMLSAAPSGGEGWRGGGHAAFLPDGGFVLLSERAPRSAGGTLESHYGRITVRDPSTLRVRESWSSYGVDPHDIRLIDQGRILAIANYGSLPRMGERELSVPRHVREACVTLVEVASGKLVDKRIVDTKDTELRHIAAADIDRIFGIQAKLGPPSDGVNLEPVETTAESADITGEKGLVYLPAPTLKLAGKTPPLALGDDAARRYMRHGLSIVFDDMHDQVIATFPSTHHVMAFEASTGRLLMRADTSRLGLRFPCGVALLPDRKHYVVTGYWENLYVFERATHRIIRDKCLYPSFFGHSHITAI